MHKHKWCSVLSFRVNREIDNDDRGNRWCMRARSQNMTRKERLYCHINSLLSFSVYQQVMTSSRVSNGLWIMLCDVLQYWKRWRIKDHNINVIIMNNERSSFDDQVSSLLGCNEESERDETWDLPSSFLVSDRQTRFQQLVHHPDRERECSTTCVCRIEV